MGRLKIKIIALGLILGLAWLPLQANAQTPCSSTYCAPETFFGTGGELNACSSGTTGYCAKQSAGETAVGKAGSTNFGIQAGFNTTDAPFLEFNITANNIDLGTLSTASTTTTTATFYVRAYLASGYSVITMSDPPHMGSYNLQNLTSPTAASAGSEQFGMNLKANTSPTTFGADPSQYPDSSFGFGFAASGYDTANVYKYVKGDTIAGSNSSSGRTDYTIAYIFNVSSITPGGTYTFNHDMVAVATY